MPTNRQIRELAIQALYQYDARGDADLDDIRRSIADAPASAEVIAAALHLATGAWAAHADADATVALLTPEWPTHRQPPIDRSILRLAFFEIVSQRAPISVAINEAVELAKAYGTERSATFINGVLDRIVRQLVAHAPPQVPDPLAPPPADNPLVTRLDSQLAAPNSELETDPSPSD